MTFAKRPGSAIYLPEDGLFSAAIAFQSGKTGVTGTALPGRLGGKTPFYGRDSFQRKIVLGTNEDDPTLPTITIQRLLEFGRDALTKASITGNIPYAQLRFHDCASSLDIATGWKMMIHYGKTAPGDIAIGDSAAIDGADGTISVDTPLLPNYGFWWWKPVLRSQTTSEAQAANSIKFFSDPLCDDGNGFVGADKIGLMAHDAGSGVSANISFTKNEGGTWTTATATDPFGNDEHAGQISNIVSYDKDQYATIISRITTDAGAPAEVVLALGSKSTGDINSYTVVNVGSTNGEIITATMWSQKQPNNVYAATDGGEIYKSKNRGASFSTTALTSSNAIRKIYEAPNGDVYAVGDGNKIYIEKSGTDSFTELTGPTGSNNSNAIAVGDDGILLGNGTKLFYATKLEPTNNADWTEQYDWGANHALLEIGLCGRSVVTGGTTQAAFYGVGDTTGTNGDVWLSGDGGETMEEVSDLSNNDYNAFYFSPLDDSTGWAAGEPVSSLAVVHRLAP